MSKLKMHCLGPQSVFTNTICVLFMLMAVLLVASPALAADIDVQGTKVTLGGYIKLQAIYDNGGSSDGASAATGVPGAPMDGDVAGAYDVVIDDDPFGGGYDDKDDFRMTARESRIFVKTNTKGESGVLNTHIEGDFFGNPIGDSGTWSNSSTFRLRHAYGSYASGKSVLVAGQTWSNFMDLAAGIPDMDIGGDPGFPFVRQPQIKYQYNLRPGHYIAVSLENPDRGFVGATGGPAIMFVDADAPSDEKMPDLILKHFYANKRMTLSPRIVLRQFDLTDEATDESRTATGWGVALSGSVKGGPVRFGLTLMYGNGMGRYGDLGNIAGAGLTADGEIKTIKFRSINGGFTFTLSPTVQWNIGAGIAENDEDDVYDDDNPILTGYATKKTVGYHTNVKWQVTKGFEWAIGAGHYEREVMDGRDGSMTRFQTYFKYDF